VSSVPVIPGWSEGPDPDQRPDGGAIAGVDHKIRHSGSLAWRALALLQEAVERKQALLLPRGARVA
jgi:hypothetical protein